jgi:hypothetical protein
LQTCIKILNTPEEPAYDAVGSRSHMLVCD